MCVPVCALPLAERRRASRAVLGAQAGGAGHVVVGHRGRLHGLQGLVGRVASVQQGKGKLILNRGNSFFFLSLIQCFGILKCSFNGSLHPMVPRPDMGGLGGFCVGGLVLDRVPPLTDWLFPSCCGEKKRVKTHTSFHATG